MQKRSLQQFPQVDPVRFHIKENSFWAKLASRKLRAEKIAMVLGSTIHLHNTGFEEFLCNRRWLRHELAHVRQYRKLGFWGFLWKYTWESVKKGYHQNSLEVEARMAETDESLDSFVFHPSQRQAERLT